MRSLLFVPADSARKLDTGMASGADAIIIDLEDAIVQQVSTMRPADYAAEAQRCGGSLQTKGQQITALGEHLIERGRQMQEKSATPSP